MPQPVKLSDALINAARETAPLADRSLAAQIEHWANLGRSIEGNITANQSAALKSTVREPSATYTVPRPDLAKTLAEAIAKALAPSAQSEFRDELASSGQPVYGTDPAAPGLIVRRNPDGTRTLGEWRDGDFQALPEEPVSKSTKPKRATPTPIHRPLKAKRIAARR